MSSAIRKKSTSSSVVSSTCEPMTAAQAEKLVGKAIRTASTFAEIMRQLLEGRAWEALGYSNPRDMIRARFTGKLVNPHSGQLYDRRSIQRLANSVWVLWSLAELTGVEPSELTITTSALAAIPTGASGKNHQQLVDNIYADVVKYGASTADEVQAIVSAHMKASSKAKKVTIPDRAVLDKVDSSVEDRRSQKLLQLSNSDDQKAGRPQTHFADSSSKNTVGSAASEVSQAVSLQDAASAIAVTTTVTHHVDAVAEFPQKILTMFKQVEELAHQVSAAISEVRHACQQAQKLAGITSAEGLFDPLSEQELDQLRTQILQAQDAIPIVKTVGNLVSGLDDVEESWKLDEIVQAVEEVENAMGVLEDFLVEIDFVYDL